jgi:hypothetical protein
MHRALCFFVLLLVACDNDPGSTGGGGGSTTSTSSSSADSSSTSQGTCGAPGQGGEGSVTLVVDGGSPQSVNRLEKVTLQGTATSSLCGGELTFLWTQTSGTEVVLDDPFSLTPSFTAPDTDTTLEFRLNVSGAHGEEGESSTQVQVYFSPPVAHAGPDQGGLAGATITLQGSSTPIDVPVNAVWTQISGPPVPLVAAGSFTPTLVLPEGLTESLVYALVVDEHQVLSAPDWVTVRRLTGPDTDGDLLEDELELTLGTDPGDPDSDDDGIPDGWEVLGHESVDYAALGCTPRHRDLLVETAVQEIMKDGVLHSANPTAGVRAALVDFYAALDLPNQDGVPGVALHLVDGAILDESFVCVTGFAGLCSVTEAPGDFRYREAFHRAAFCFGAGAQGCGDIGGRTFGVNHLGIDADPMNDRDEPAAYDLYGMFIHEMGHNLGLPHGGGDWLNYKPNYPSTMNYAYDVFSRPGTINTREVLLSRGLLPALDECTLAEQGIFAGISAADLAFLPTYKHDAGWTADAGGSVDWNHDGVVSSAPHAQSFVGEQACNLLTDNDDIATIDKGLALALPSNLTHPMWRVLGQRPTSVP